MAAKGWRKCAECKEWLFEAGRDYDGGKRPKDLDKEREFYYGEVSHKMICEWCEESDIGDHASTVVRWDPELKLAETVRVGDHRAMDVTDYDEPPAWFWKLWPKKGRTYRRTDAWRGYYDTELKGLHKVTDGWVTGYPDESVSRKMALAELYEKIHTGSGPDVVLYWLFEPTSNVFSTASTVYLARKRDEKRLNAWLEENGSSVGEFEEAFA